MLLCRHYTDFNRYSQIPFYTSLLEIERRYIMVSYAPLWETMKKKNVTTYTLIQEHQILSKTIYNLKHNKNISTATLERLCEILECTPNDILTFEK